MFLFASGAWRAAFPAQERPGPAVLGVMTPSGEPETLCGRRVYP